MENNIARVLIAMSGGVDSSVAAFVMREQGYDCAGVTLRLGQDADVEDACSVAQRLGIPFFVFDFAEAFEREVIRRFVSAYRRGETPNPCVDCNRFIKFGALLPKAEELDYPYIVTGHYVRREFDSASNRYILRKGLDTGKDQSYVLYTLTQAQLARALFPLGGMTKAEVRRTAEAQGFINAAKKDSQDICFVPDGDYGGFLERYTGHPLTPGNFIDAAGRVLGRHRGTPRYTLGQRKGLGLALPAPGYVCAIDPAANTVTVGGEDRLFSSRLEAVDINMIACERLDAPIRVRAKIRYSQQEQWATAEQTAPDRLHLEFDAPQRAITPGQAVVLYDGDVVVGGGRII